MAKFFASIEACLTWLSGGAAPPDCMWPQNSDQDVADLVAPLIERLKSMKMDPTPISFSALIDATAALLDCAHNKPGIEGVVVYTVDQINEALRKSFFAHRQMQHLASNIEDDEDMKDLERMASILGPNIPKRDEYCPKALLYGASMEPHLSWAVRWKYVGFLHILLADPRCDLSTVPFEPYEFNAEGLTLLQKALDCKTPHLGMVRDILRQGGANGTSRQGQHAINQVCRRLQVVGDDRQNGAVWWDILDMFLDDDAFDTMTLVPTFVYYSRIPLVHWLLECVKRGKKSAGEKIARLAAKALSHVRTKHDYVDERNMTAVDYACEPDVPIGFLELIGKRKPRVQDNAGVSTYALLRVLNEPEKMALLLQWGYCPLRVSVSNGITGFHSFMLHPGESSLEKAFRLGMSKSVNAILQHCKDPRKVLEYAQQQDYLWRAIRFLDFNMAGVLLCWEQWPLHEKVSTQWRFGDGEAIADIGQWDFLVSDEDAFIKQLIDDPDLNCPVLRLFLFDNVRELKRMMRAGNFAGDTFSQASIALQKMDDAIPTASELRLPFVSPWESPATSRRAARERLKTLKENARTVREVLLFGPTPKNFWWFPLKMRSAVEAMLLVDLRISRQEVAVEEEADKVVARAQLPAMPTEMWLWICRFLLQADYAEK